MSTIGLVAGKKVTCLKFWQGVGTKKQNKTKEVLLVFRELNRRNTIFCFEIELSLMASWALCNFPTPPGKGTVKEMEHRWG